MNHREAESILALWAEIDQGLDLVDESKEDASNRWRDELAAERVVERIFQAAEALPPDVRHHHFGADGFSRLRGMRNRLAHNYREIDGSILWRTLRVELPQVRSRLAEDCHIASAIVLAEQFTEDEDEWLLAHLSPVESAML